MQKCMHVMQTGGEKDMMMTMHLASAPCRHSCSDPRSEQKGNIVQQNHNFCAVQAGPRILLAMESMRCDACFATTQGVVEGCSDRSYFDASKPWLWAVRRFQTELLKHHETCSSQVHVLEMSNLQTVDIMLASLGTAFCSFHTRGAQ